jgi:aminoglycoside phosphotransferase (APT) family kinase protein
LLASVASIIDCPMNRVAAFLAKNWERLALDRFGAPSRLLYVVSTPRFRASKHVIFIILAEDSSDPILIAKVPRLTGALHSLDREAANLRAVQGVRAGGFDSIPRVVAYEDHAGSPLLIETALVGRTMNPAFARRQPTACAEAALHWLTGLHLTTAGHSELTGDSFGRLVENPLAHFERVFPLFAEEECLIAKTRELTSPLCDHRLPLVFAHGDLSSPNILVLKPGSIGVVDWELAEPRGLPATDLFFFLTYLAFARRRAQKRKEYLEAFHEAFFGPTAWARTYIARYAERLGLSANVIKPLFVLCWSQYVIGLLARLSDFENVPTGIPERETASWLRGNRYFALWRHAVQHLSDVNLLN